MNYRTEEYRSSQREKYRALRQQVYAGYGNRCSCCGESEPSFLTIDHVNGNGTADRQRRNPIYFYACIIKEGFPAIYRLLCANCNQGRAVNGGICPHER